MEPEVLNRIGIILNFMAGFLLAPELLGTERLQKLEQFLERLAAKLEAYGDVATSKLRQLSDEFFVPAFNLLGLHDSKTKSKEMKWFVVFIWVFLLIGFVYYRKEQSPDQNIARRFLVFIFVSYSIPMLLIIIWALSHMFVLLARLLVNKLAGENQLRSGLVWLGIICFIAGNTLQFIATF